MAGQVEKTCLKILALSAVIFLVTDESSGLRVTSRQGMMPELWSS